MSDDSEANQEVLAPCPAENEQSDDPQEKIFIKFFGIENEDDLQADPPKFFLGTRHVFALMGFLGLACSYLMRVNLPAALIEVTQFTPSSTAYDGLQSTEWPLFENSSQEMNGTVDLILICRFEDDGEFAGQDQEVQTEEAEWSEEDQYLVLGAVLWGYLLTQVPAGFLADQYGGKHVFGIGVLFSSILCLFTPLAARFSVQALISVRFLTGLFLGTTLPAANAMISKWAPCPERTTIGAIVLSGMRFGPLISLPLEGFRCKFNYYWEWTFYIPGTLGIIWYVAWILLVYDNPEVHPHIDEDERRYIAATTRPNSTKPIPWKTIATSIQLWSILVCHVGYNWGSTVLLMELPTYLKMALHFDMRSYGLLSVAPCLMMWTSANIFSQAADTLRKRKVVTTTVIRKVSTSIGLSFPAAFLIGASFTNCNSMAILIVVTLAAGFSGSVYSGFMINHIDVASNHAGILMGVTSCAASLAALSVPPIVNRIVTIPVSLYQWHLVLYLAAVVYAATNFFYIVVGTGVEQPWHRPDEANQNQSETISAEDDEETIVFPTQNNGEGSKIALDTRV